MKFYLFILAAFFCAAPLSAEVISFVNFNPSRMGEYDYLKVSEKAVLQGGLQTERLEVESGGTVTVNAADNLNYNITTVKTEDFPSATVTVSMSTASFKGGDSVNLPDVNLYGGTTSFEGENSYVATLQEYSDAGRQAETILRQRAGSIEADTVVIAGPSKKNGASLVTLYGDDDDDDNSTTKGFHLAGNDIPEPTVGHVVDKNGGTTELTGSSCGLIWEERETVQGTSVRVLAIKC